MMKRLPDSKRDLIDTEVNELSSRSDEEESKASSSDPFCKEECAFVLDWNDGDTLIENEMTQAEIECTELL